MAPVDRDALAARVRAAINESGKQHQAVAEAAEMSPSALSRALSGQRHFKSLELALIAEFVDVSVESFLDDEAPSSSVGRVAARIDADSNVAVAEALQRLTVLGDLDHFLESIQYGAPRSSPAVEISWGLPPHTQGSEVARQLREWMGFGASHFPTDLDALVRIIEVSLSIDIAIEPLSSGIDGLSAKQGESKFILLNSRVASTRLRWTLAHEIGHLLLGDCDGVTVDENIWGVKTPEETRANGFAAEFLVPAALLQKEATGQEITEDLIGYLLGQFRISLDAMAFRLHNCGIVNAAQRDQIRAMSSRSIAFRNGRVDDLQARLDRRVPERLLTALFDAFYRGDASIRPLASLLQVDPEQLFVELSSYQGRETVAGDEVSGF